MLVKSARGGFRWSTTFAQQVNLLALNAHDRGKPRRPKRAGGFAVVAAEVKSLAQQTAAATAQISEARQPRSRMSAQTADGRQSMNIGRP